MLSEWRETTLGEVINFRRGHDLPKTKMMEGTIPVVGSNGIIGYHDKHTTDAPCVSIGRSGNVGNPHIIMEKCWAHNTTLYIDDFKGNDEVFVYYFLQTLNLHNFRGGSAVPTLNRNHIHPMDVRIPPLSEQKAIAHILGSLDDKIELNRKMNETLEAMAQAMFKSWFVDFDPVIDNALAAGNLLPEELRQKGEVIREKLEEKYGSLDAAASHFTSHPSGFHSLFPSEFIFTDELGWIPKGWEVSHIGKEATCVGGATPSTKNVEFWDDGDIHWTTPKDLSSQTTKILLDTNRKITESGLKKISSGLMPVDTVLMSSRAPVGYLALAKVPVAINQGYIAMKCEKTLTPEYVIQWAESIMDDIKQRSGGTTFAEISKKHFREIPVLVSDVEILNYYSVKIKDNYNKITENVTQSIGLAKLRDMLLPKLLSGTVRLKKV